LSFEKENEMQLYDISQELFTCAVFPGDPAPKRETLASIEGGDLYNLTAFSMCAHNGTHIDAPAHFLRDGATVDELPLSKTTGFCTVVEHDGILTAADASRLLADAKKASPEAAQRILIKGKATVSNEAATVFAEAHLELFGNESQSVGPEDAPLAAHLALLSVGTVLLEGIRLSHVPVGVYLLSAAPINLGGCEGAPCRALLISLS
jgi:arylformamidase